MPEFPSGPDDIANFMDNVDPAFVRPDAEEVNGVRVLNYINDLHDLDYSMIVDMCLSAQTPGAHVRLINTADSPELSQRFTDPGIVVVWVGDAESPQELGAAVARSIDTGEV